MLEEIQKISRGFEADAKVKKMPMFLSLTLPERESLLRLEKKLNISKNRIVGIACQYMINKLDETQGKSEKDGKKV